MSAIKFQAGGPLLSGSAVYIRRKADDRAAECLRRMDYITLVEPRQYGKTSLINHLRSQFPSQEGYTFAGLDLMGAPSHRTSITSWYTWVGTWLRRQLSFFPAESRNPTDSGSWEDFLVDIAERAEVLGQNVVIVLDEIGALPPEYATDFFSVIRSIYTSRQSFSFWHHLTFVIAGAFNPKDLIQDRAVSNFNVDQRIVLDDFNLDQVLQLITHLDLPRKTASALAKRIYYWTEGQPYLTQRLCLTLSETSSIIRSPAKSVVDNAVDRFFHEDTNHLSHVMELADNSELLAYLRRITEDSPSRFSAALNERHFRLAHIIGVLKASADGMCRVRNPIYERALSEMVSSRTAFPTVVTSTQQQAVVQDVSISQASSQEDISHQQEKLRIHRRNLTVYLESQARQGVSHTAPEVFHGIREARLEIRRIKKILRQWNMRIDDHPDDDDPEISNGDR